MNDYIYNWMGMAKSLSRYRESLAIKCLDIKIPILSFISFFALTAMSPLYMMISLSLVMMSILDKFIMFTIKTIDNGFNSRYKAIETLSVIFAVVTLVYLLIYAGPRLIKDKWFPKKEDEVVPEDVVRRNVTRANTPKTKDFKPKHVLNKHDLLRRDPIQVVVGGSATQTDYGYWLTSSSNRVVSPRITYRPGTNRR